MEKLIHFLKTLTDAEIRLLTKIFIKQKINPTLLQLYKQLIQAHPSYENLDEKKLANKIKDTNGTASAFTCALAYAGYPDRTDRLFGSFNAR